MESMGEFQVFLKRILSNMVVHKILKKIVGPSDSDLKLKPAQVIQQGKKNLYHTTKSTSELIKNNKVKVLNGVSQS